MTFILIFAELTVTTHKMDIMIDMYEIPLFPLNTVLFPDMPMPLHIFEERYKLMINECLEQKQPFGVVLIQDGEAEHGPLATPHEIGCTAEVLQVQHLEDERMLIMAVGHERFRIVELKRDKPYLVGVVEKLNLDQENEQVLNKMSDRLRPFVIDYLEILAKIGRVNFDAHQVPADPLSLSYLAASVLQIPADEKQDLLVTNKMTRLLQSLHT